MADFDVLDDLIALPNSEVLSVEIRVAMFRTKPEPVNKYLLVFVFDKEKKNRLILLTSTTIEDISSYLVRQKLAGADDCVLIVGKEGSRVDNQTNIAFHENQFKKLIALDFAGKLSLVDFLKEVASDIDRVETRKRSLNDQARADLTSLPISEKRIKDGDENRKQLVMFANQLLQLPGITEHIALALAESFGTPLELMGNASRSDTLDCFTFVSKGENKKLNIRVKTGIRKVFNRTADPTETIK